MSHSPDELRQQLAECTLLLIEAQVHIQRMTEESKAARIFTGMLVDRLGGSIEITAEEIQMYMQASKKLSTVPINSTTARYSVEISADADRCDCPKCKDMTAAYSQFKH